MLVENTPRRPIGAGWVGCWWVKFQDCPLHQFLASASWKVVANYQ